MNKKIKSKWVEALRSGEFKQTTGRLKRLEGEKKSYCCLGVLCELHRRETGKGMWSNDYDPSYLTDVDNSAIMSCLPNIVQEWAGLDSNNPSVNGGSLIDLNDGRNFSFIQIADVIEKEL